MSKSDIQIKQHVEDELLWDPTVNSAKVGVSVDHGAVTLTGAVDTYSQKWAIEAAVMRVAGVRTVAQDTTINALSAHKRSDSELAAAVENALRWDVVTPAGVRASVQNSVVTLHGEVALNCERDAAESAVRHLMGVVEVINLLRLKGGASAVQVKDQIQSALARQAQTDASSIQVEADLGKVTLAGYAPSWQSIRNAVRAAWAAPGVTEVVDHVTLQMMD